jgi:hypothetical protein
VREFGCASAGSVTRIDRAVGFIAHDRTVRVLGGYDAEVVSNPGVERWLADSDMSTVDAFSWQAHGHTFYALSTSTGTFVFDLRTKEWHERDSYGYTRWRATCYAFHNGRHIVGDDTGKLYVMSDAYHDEAGQPLICDIQPAPVNTFPGRAIVSRMYLDMVPAVGRDTAAAPDDNPQIWLSSSDDGGRTFGTERAVPIGREGEVLRRMQWLRLGLVRSTGRIWRFRASAAVTKAVMAASMDVEQLAA